LNKFDLVQVPDNPDNLDLTLNKLNFVHVHNLQDTAFILPRIRSASPRLGKLNFAQRGQDFAPTPIIPPHQIISTGNCPRNRYLNPTSVSSLLYLLDFFSSDIYLQLQMPGRHTYHICTCNQCKATNPRGVRWEEREFLFHRRRAAQPNPVQSPPRMQRVTPSTSAYAEAESSRTEGIAALAASVLTSTFVEDSSIQPNELFNYRERHQHPPVDVSASAQPSADLLSETISQSVRLDLTSSYTATTGAPVPIPAATSSDIPTSSTSAPNPPDTAGDLHSELTRLDVSDHTHNLDPSSLDLYNKRERHRSTKKASDFLECISQEIMALREVVMTAPSLDIVSQAHSNIAQISSTLESIKRDTESVKAKKLGVKKEMNELLDRVEERLLYFAGTAETSPFVFDSCRLFSSLPKVKAQLSR
jgi:hypothetical protein